MRLITLHLAHGFIVGVRAKSRTSIMKIKYLKYIIFNYRKKTRLCLSKVMQILFLFYSKNTLFFFFNITPNDIWCVVNISTKTKQYLKKKQEFGCHILYVILHILRAMKDFINTVHFKAFCFHHILIICSFCCYLIVTEWWATPDGC